jgi:hypothetical protein
MKRIFVLLALVACQPVAGTMSPDASVPPPEVHKLGAIAAGATSFGQLACGADGGTVVVPSGWYASGIAAHSSSATATLTITPWGPGIVDAGLGPNIPIPSTGLGIGYPMIQGTELGAGTAVTCTTCDSCVVTLHPTAN